MSSLIFYTDKEQALIATDTLGVDSEGAPFLFTSKAIHIPHLKVVICGTGCGGFSNEWALHVNNRMVLGGILNLDYHTERYLSELWEKYKLEYKLPDDFSTTVYHFGFSEESGEIVGFAYRSANNFTSEQLQHGTGVKPECSVLDGNLFETIPLMMQEQREIQESLPKNERVYIGGEIFAIHLTSNGCSTQKLGEFPDYKDNLKSIFENYRSV